MKKNRLFFCRPRKRYRNCLTLIKSNVPSAKINDIVQAGEGEFSVQDIVDNVGTSQSNISQHLAILRDKGILSARKDANKVFYKVSDFKTLKLIDMMREVFCSKHN